MTNQIKTSELTKIVERIINLIPKYENDSFLFQEKGSTSYPISENNFHKIEPKEINKVMAFIDGGNAEIFSAPNFSVHFIRIFCSVWKGKKVNFRKRYEAYTLANLALEKNDFVCNVELFQENDRLLENLRFNKLDKKGEDDTKTMISKAGSIVRRFCEIKAASTLIDELEEGSILLFDGTLEARFEEENRLLEELYEKALKKNIVICALSKTTTLFTKKGNSIAAMLNAIGPKEPWYYFPVVEISNELHRARIFFVKLHERSDYVFRFESFKESSFNANELFGILAKFSKDSAFLGYPYGLLDADRFARISNEEREILKARFVAAAGKRWEMLVKYANAINTHDVLDERKFY